MHLPSIQFLLLLNFLIVGGNTLPRKKRDMLNTQHALEYGRDEMSEALSVLIQTVKCKGFDYLQAYDSLKSLCDAYDEEKSIDYASTATQTIELLRKAQKHLAPHIEKVESYVTCFDSYALGHIKKVNSAVQTAIKENIEELERLIQLYQSKQAE